MVPDEVLQKAFTALEHEESYMSDCVVVTRARSGPGPGPGLTQNPDCGQFVTDDDGRCFYAHRLVLCRCSKLERLFKNGENVVTISSYAAESVLEMLRFLYREEVKHLQRTVTVCNGKQLFLAEDLYALACEYSLVDLQKMCLDTLSKIASTISMSEELFHRFLALSVYTISQQLWAWFCSNFTEALLHSVAQSEAGREFLRYRLMLSSGYVKPEMTNGREMIRHSLSAINNSVISGHRPDFDRVLSDDDSRSDFAIYVNDSTKPLRVHKVILSRVHRWERMFEHPSEECRRGYAVVDLGREAMLEVLEYVYVGSNGDLSRPLCSGGDVSIAEDVIGHADEYGLGELQERCIDVLEKAEVTRSNVVRLLSLATSHSVQPLLERCLDVFFSESEVTILHHNDWLECSPALDVIVRSVVEFEIQQERRQEEVEVEEEEEEEEEHPPGIVCIRRCDFSPLHLSSLRCEIYDGTVCDGTTVIEVENVAESEEECLTKTASFVHKNQLTIVLQRKVILIDTRTRSSTIVPVVTPENVVGYAVTHHKGQLYLSGGVHSGQQSNRMYMFNKKSNTWMFRSTMNNTHSNHAMVSLGEFLYVFGGSTNCVVERCNFETHQWEYIGEYVCLRGHPTVGAIDGQFWVHNHTAIRPHNHSICSIDAETGD